MQALHRHLFQLRQTRLLRLVAVTAAVLLGYTTVYLLYLRDDFPDDGVSLSSNPSTNYVNSTCSVDLDRLRAHAPNASVVQYARLEIVVARTRTFTGYSDSLNVSLPTYQSVRLDTDRKRERLPEERCATSVTIPGPVDSAPANASHLIFGVATSMERLNASLDAFAHWAGGTNAQIVAVVDKGGSLLTPTMERANALGIRLTVVEQQDEVLDRYFSLIRILMDRREESTQWAVLIDDDTFFPSMQNLVNRLASYDATQPQYIGALSEDMSQMYGAGHIAYGGAGVFLSIPLMQELHEVFDDCYLFKGAGDGMVAQCIYEHTTTKLTWDRDLHQLDLRGDASGFYESGRPLPLSLHHWKSWHHADMVALGKVAAVCGEGCLLRRLQLADDWYLVNGFSVIKYSRPLRDPNVMEQTWEDSQYQGVGPFAYSLGPLRGRDEDKVSLRMREAQVEGPGRVRQVYVREDEDAQVLDVVWKVAS
ncbi:hypothetical protein EYZ11_005491 [Aspergillus tanneri]|uniref:Glycosyltransferase family 31 protein n=1 Tax=Aspergillus tanneri TaxID=1220188 RepID=A0A4S3JIE2_9EURO|nr:uncharacterized protein ATNIH1004_002496 [Aspergillus tanneri]KAA8649819.1 hypothetical protein ATNIH1004_002496 [Aspergillus tanneri]THC95015.1 hypothetical protein EYZ11_005491 [Aspergillus tanneri]